MRVYIGPYKHWVGPYQIAELTRYLGASEETQEKIGDWLANKTPLSKICEWVHSLKRRRVRVHIHRYDTWNMDTTLAHVILPMLDQLRSTKHGSPHVDDEDVPAHLRSTAALPKENDWDTDSNWHARWEWVLDHMIEAFNSKLDEDADDSDPAVQRLRTEGFRLFGKYYEALWD